MSLSKRVSVIHESATLKLNALATSLKAEGKDVVNLTAGETDFNVADSAKDAVLKAVENNLSKYTPVSGVPELRELICEKTNRQQPSLSKEPWAPENVLVSNGAKHSLFNLLLTLVDPGDEVAFASPFWLSYPEMVKVAGGVPVPLETRFKENFKLRASDLSKLGKDIKVLILNSPSNPTGAVYSREELEEIAKEVRKRSSLYVVSDEIYDEIVFPPAKFTSFLEVAPDLRHRCITVNGVSKSAAMTGWRLGWAVGPKDIVKAMTKLQGQSTSGVSALSQAAAVAALKLPESHFRNQREVLEKKRDLVFRNLSKIGKIKVMAPDGAFYFFIGVGEDAGKFCEALLKDALVALVPGNSFGAGEYVRLSFATDESSLQEGCDRIAKFFENRP